MSLQLRDEDRRAIDLLLDRGPAAKGNRSAAPLFAEVSAGVRERLPAVEKLFQTLDLLPTAEPPHDLMARTLRRLDDSMADHPAALRVPQTVVADQRAHA